jgi:hypothetical protein
LELLLPPHPIARLRLGDRNDSPTWLLNVELRSYGGTVPSDSFFAWQAYSLRLIASYFQTITARISIQDHQRRCAKFNWHAREGTGSVKKVGFALAIEEVHIILASRGSSAADARFVAGIIMRTLGEK